MYTNRKKTDDSVHFPDFVYTNQKKLMICVHKPDFVYTNRKKTDDSAHFPDFVYTYRKKTVRLCQVHTKHLALATVTQMKMVYLPISYTE